MAIDALSGAYIPPAFVKPLPGTAEAFQEELTRVVVSSTTVTRADGSSITTVYYSDGTSDTQTTQGDTVDLSSEAQSLLAA